MSERLRRKVVPFYPQTREKTGEINVETLGNERKREITLENEGKREINAGERGKHGITREEHYFRDDTACSVATCHSKSGMKQSRDPEFHFGQKLVVAFF